MLDQFIKYQNDSRVDFTGVMKGLVNALSVEEQLAVVVFYASEELVPPAVQITPGQSDRGGEIYRSYCFVCHGDSGLGKPGYPRIAGQQPQYISDVLKLFRDGSGGQARDRHSEAMVGMASVLSDADIESLSLYVSSLYQR